jgi:hypothetical protein
MTLGGRLFVRGNNETQTGHIALTHRATRYPLCVFLSDSARQADGRVSKPP